MKKLFAIIVGLGMIAPVLAEEAAAPMKAAESTEAKTTTASETSADKQLAAGNVARATFTKGMADREPIDSIDTLSSAENKIYYFTDLRDMAGQTVTHRWEYNGKVMAEVPFTVGGPRWRVFSSKNLENIWLGEWKVTVIDQSGGVLAVNTFKYNKSSDEASDEGSSGAAAQPAAGDEPTNQ